jgi:hypothetical protein
VIVYRTKIHLELGYLLYFTGLIQRKQGYTGVLGAIWSRERERRTGAHLVNDCRSKKAKTSSFLCSVR